MEITDVDPWRKSSYSENGGATCVEVGRSAATILVRDTTNRDGAHLRLTAGDWQSFISTVR